MKGLFKVVGIGLVVFTVFKSCQTKTQQIENNKKENFKDSIEENKRKLKEEFKKEYERNQRKFDSLKIKQDSLRNKSNLSDFNDEAPVFDQLEKK